jgi:hypothetical protein
MKHLSSSLLAVAVATTAATAQSLITESARTFTVGSDIADVQNPPAAFLQTVNDSAIVSLTRVEVGLHLVGTSSGAGFASEMFVSLNQNLGQTAVLLNQVGVTSGDPVGQGYDGWNVTFRDDAVNGDVHAATLASGTLTGIWAPDARSAATDPGTSRPLTLSLFNNGTGNGDWRLLVGDLTPGGTMRLQSWSLTFTGYTAVPEPGAYALLTGLGLLAVAGWLRRGR